MKNHFTSILTQIIGVSLMAFALGAPAHAARVSPSHPDGIAGSAAHAPRAVARDAVQGPTDVKNLDTGEFFATIQDALNDVDTQDLHVLEVQVTPHSEGIVTVGKQVTLQGMAGGAVIEATTSTGSAGDARGWFLVTVPNVTFKDLTLDGRSGSGVDIHQAIRFKEGGAVVTGCGFRDIRFGQYTGIAVVGFKNTTVTGCTFTNIERLGVSLFGPDVTAGVVSGCTYTGKGSGDHLDYGVELGGGAVATLTDNTFTACTGVASDGSTSAGVLATDFYGPGTRGTLTGNFLNGNTQAIAAGYAAGDATVLVVHDNDLSGNVSDAIGSSLNNTLDASGNWWGSNLVGDVAAEVAGNPVDFTPWLDGGADTDLAVGFQGDFSILHVDDDSPQSGAVARIQEGVNLVTASIVLVGPGLYHERLLLNKSVDLRGAQYGVDPTPALARTNPAAESVVDVVGLGVPNPDVLVEIPAGTTNVLVSGFTLNGGQSTPHNADQSAVRCWDDHVTIQDNIIDGYVAVLYKGNDYFEALRNRITANKAGVVVQPNVATNVTVSGNSIVRGPSPAGDETGVYLTNVSDAVVSGNTSTGFVGGRALQGSNNTRLQILQNSFTGNRDAISIFGNSTFMTITGNTLSGNTRFGINIKGADIVITDNFIQSNGDAGVSIDKNTIVTERVRVNHNDITGNTNYGIAVVNPLTVPETINGECNWYGHIDGPNAPTHPGPGDRVTATVDFVPWLDGSISGTPGCNQFLPSNTTLSSDINPSDCTQKVVLTATVSPSSLTGSVDFFDGGALIGSAALVAGSATLSVPSFSPGHHALTAQYGGGGDYEPSTSSPYIQNVHCAGTLTTVQVTTCDTMGWHRDNMRDLGMVDITASYPRAGTGSLEFGTANASSKADWVRPNGNADLLTTLSALQVELYRNATSTSAAHFAPVVRLFVDNGNATDRYSYLIWEPVYNGYPAFPTNTWTSLDLFKGNFWQRAFKTTPPNVTIEIYNRTLADWLVPGTVTDGGGNVSNVVGPNARVLSYEIGVGSGWAGTFHGAADNFRIGFNGADSLFNFDPSLLTAMVFDVSPASSQCGDKVTLTATVTPSEATGTVEFSDQGGAPAYFEGFETDLGGEPGWDHGASTFTPTRVPSGTNGIASATGGFHAEAATANGSAFTRWGGYNTVFPAGGYTTMVDVYLDMAYASGAGDVRFDFSSAINTANPTPTHRRDFVFNFGTEPTGFVVSVGNNAGRSNSYPSNPGQDPVHLTLTGWYTLKHRFYNDGGVLACDLSIIDPSGTVIVGGPAWTKRDPSDVIGVTVGGNRYGWFANQELPVLAFDNARRVTGSLGSASLVNGVAMLSVPSLAVGSHALVATYVGGACFLGTSSDKVAHDVARAPSTTALASDINPSAHGTKVTFTVTVTPAGATGTVELFDGATSLGVQPVTAGVATFSIATLANGSHSMTAVYGGDECYDPSTSAPLNQVVNDLDAPTVHVDHPTAPNIVVFIGEKVIIRWTATDDKGVESVTIRLSRDNLGTFEDLAIDIPNTGEYSWMVDNPATNTGPDPEYTAYIQVIAKDAAGNQGSDLSDNPFAIYDLVTETLLSLFQATPVRGGVELRWQFGAPEVVKSASLERASSATGPWTRVEAEPRFEGDVTTVVDGMAEAGQTYWYRLQAVLADGQTLSFGPLSGMADVAITSFALRSIAPNPSKGVTRIDYAVPRESEVRLSVLDVQGREVAVLAHGNTGAGYYQATWNGNTERGMAPAGLYFVRLKAPGQNLVRRLALSR